MQGIKAPKIILKRQRWGKKTLRNAHLQNFIMSQHAKTQSTTKLGVRDGAAG